MKNTTVATLTDIICPHYCRGCKAVGSVLCRCCKNDISEDYINYCPNCKRILMNNKCKYCCLPTTFMIGWRDELIGTLVHDFKYNSTRRIGVEIAEILDEILPFFSDSIHIVPLPTIKKHVRERGIDHTLFIAKKLAKRRGWIVDQILNRNKDTVQVGMDEKNRRIQATEAYKIAKNPDKNTTYLLLDDVWTTGSSMKAAIKQLKQSGATKILVVVLAVNRMNRN